MTFIFHPTYHKSHAQPPRCGSTRVRLWLLFIAFIAFGSFSRPANAQNFTSPGSWSYTIPAGVTKIQVQVSGAGGGGGSCHFSSAQISSISIAATGATGATGKTTRVTTAGARGGTGSVVISLWAVEVVKTSTITSDAVSGSNPKALPGATMRYCIFVRNNWGGDATNLIVTDALPAQTSFVGNSFNKGTTCADATNSEPFAFLIGSDVVAFVGALPTSATYALAFQVTLN